MALGSTNSPGIAGKDAAEARKLAAAANKTAGEAKTAADNAVTQAGAAKTAAEQAKAAAETASTAAQNAQTAAQKAAADMEKINQAIEENGGSIGTGGNVIKITFEAAFVGKQYTVTGGDDTKTGTVPESRVVSVSVVNCNTVYTIKATANNGVEYSTTVTTGAYYGQYTATLAVFTATINVTAVAGAEVKATKGSTVFSATAGSNGVAAVPVNQTGTYSITATKDGAQSNSASVNVTAQSTYTATVNFIVLTVKAPSGSALTLTKGDKTFTKTTAGTDVFYLPSTGTWTGTISKDGETATGSVNAAAYQAYTLELSFIKIIGVCWNYGSTSTALTRLTKANDPNNLVNHDISGTPTPAVGTGSGSSPFDSLMPWAGMEEYNVENNAVTAKQGESGFSRANKNTVVKIPEFGFKVVDDASAKKRYFYIADKPKAGVCDKHPGSGKYVGRYNTGNSGGYVSRSGLAPQVNMTRGTARTQSKAKGAKWSQYDYASWSALWLLYLVEFADWDSQSKIGRGYVDSNSSAINSGATDSMNYHTGRAAGTDGKTAVQYRHIENPWGNVWEWIDGINFNERAVYICTDPSKYADDTSSNYTAAGVTLSSDGWIKALGQSSGFPWAFLPTAIGGSETTYIPDYLYSSTGWRVLMVGGPWGHGSSAGLFYFDANYASSGTSGSLGARLLFHP